MTISPSDLKPGDRVKITVEGEVRNTDSDGEAWLLLTGGEFNTNFTPAELSHAHIERLPRPSEGQTT